MGWVNPFYPDPKWVLSIFKFNNLFLHEQLDVCWTDGEGKTIALWVLVLRSFFFIFIICYGIICLGIMRNVVLYSYQSG